MKKAHNLLVLVVNRLSLSVTEIDHPPLCAPSRQTKTCSSVFSFYTYSQQFRQSFKCPTFPMSHSSPFSNATRVTLTNRTCQQCLCASNFSHLILNCFPNGTCEFFAVSPRTYRIQSTPSARLYFPQGVYPTDSQCCMPNTTLLLSKLNATTPVQVTATSSRCLVVDNAGRLVTVSYSAKSILRFSPNSLATISTPASPTFNANPWSITHLDGAYYIGFDRWILVLNSSTLTQMHNISVPALSGTRDIIFSIVGKRWSLPPRPTVDCFFSIGRVRFHTITISSGHRMSVVHIRMVSCTSMTPSSTSSRGATIACIPIRIRETRVNGRRTLC